MNQQKFLIFYGLIAIAFTLLFVRLKFKKNRPTPLNLRKTRSSLVKNMDIDYEEELNVYFRLHGQMWDAYEIIGLPAGSSMVEVEEAYARELLRQGQQAREMLDKAYEAIHRKLSRST